METSKYFPSQIEEGRKILKSFEGGSLVCSFIAPMQWGKTGVLFYVADEMVRKGNVNGYSNVFLLTGMSDNDWRKQTRERAPEEMKGNILHRGNLNRAAKRISENIRDALFIVDECHFGALRGMTLYRFFQKVGIYNIEMMRTRNLRILQTSATPEISLINAQSWPSELHTLIKPDIPVSYFGVKDILASDTFHHSLENRIEEAFQYIAKMKTPKYHIFRINARRPEDRHSVITLAKKNGYMLRKHDCSIRKSNRVTDDEMRTTPKTHTIILVKNMWKAAKTFPSDHIGLIMSGMSDSPAVEAQGLVGRICGHNKTDKIHVVANYSIDTYQMMMDDPEHRYDNPELYGYESANVRILPGGVYKKLADSYLHPHNFVGLEDVTLPTVVKRSRSKPKSSLYNEDEDYQIERSVYHCNEGETPEQLFCRIKKELGAKWVRNPFKTKKNGIVDAIDMDEKWLNMSNLINKFNLKKNEIKGTKKFLFKKCRSENDTRLCLFVAKMEILTDLSKKNED